MFDMPQNPFFSPSVYRDVLHRAAMDTIAKAAALNEENADHDTTTYWLKQCADVMVMCGDCAMHGVSLLTSDEFKQLTDQAKRLTNLRA